MSENKSLKSSIEQKLKIFLAHEISIIRYLIKWLFICLLIGGLIGTASAGFLISLEWVTNYRESNKWIIALLPVAGLLTGMSYYYFGKEVEAGNNLLIDTIHKPSRKKIPFLMAPLVYLGTIASHLFGGSAGREGTAIQMAGSIADQFTTPLKLNGEERKVLIIAAIAAGFGSVFGTPMAGALFGLEVFLIGKIRYNAILPAFLAAIIANVVGDLWNAPHTHYHIDFIPLLSLTNIIYSILAGIAFGMCAYAFSKSQEKLSSLFNSKISYPPLRTLIGGAIVALAVLLVGTTKYIGLGIPTIVESFDKTLPLYDFIAKSLFTIVTLASGFKGGEVTPLFFIGSTMGNALSYILPLPLGLLAGMGFVAVFAGATNTPIACTIMAIELFGVECGVYVALACIVSYLISGHSSIYKNQIIGVAKDEKRTDDTDKMISQI